jgi:hypothetical protein
VVVILSVGGVSAHLDRRPDLLEQLAGHLIQCRDISSMQTTGFFRS